MRVLGLRRHTPDLSRFIVTALAVIFVFGSMAPYLSTAHALAAAETPAAPQQAPKPERRELEQNRTLTSKTYQNPDGTLTAEVSQAPVHYKDSDGKLKDIKTGVSDDGQGNLQATETYAKPKLKKKIDSDGSFGSFSVAGRDVALKITNAQDVGKKKSSVEDKGLTYVDVFNAVDLEYKVLPNGLKENIRLKNSNAQTDYSFDLSLDNAKATATESGDISFTDSRDGGALFTLPRPVMYDNADQPEANRTVSSDLRYEISNDGNTFHITVKASSDWLKDPARKYPVVIDPTVTLNAPYYDTYVVSGEATTAHGSLEWMVGGARTNGTNRSYVYFSNLPTMPANYTINSANLNLYQYEIADASAQVNIFKVTSGWNGATMTWNTMAPWTGTDATSFNDGSTNVSPNITNIVKSWYTGTPNYGVLLAYANESLGGRTWRTANYVDSNTWPKLVINYSAPYSAQFLGATQPPTSVAPGETFTQSFQYKNTGLNTWYPDGANPVHLGTQSPQDRNSPFCSSDGHWQGCARVKLDQQLVRPGDTGTFTMTMTAPTTTGTYTENWNVVVDNYSWLEQPSGVTVNVVGKAYGSAWQGQGWQGGGSQITLAKGQSALAWIDIKNTGNTTWTRDGNNPVRLGGSTSTGGTDRSSSFYTTGDWVGATRPTLTDKDKVAPGEIGRFSFVVTAPTTIAAGTYNEYFRPVMEGVTWLTDQNIYLPISVSNSSVPSVNNLGDLDYSAFVGNVNVTNGNLVLKAQDISLGAKGMNVSLDRTYNSQTGDSGILGKGWQFDFEQRLMFEGSNIRWIAEDGQSFTYTDAGSGNYNRPANTQATLTKSDPLLGPVTYTLKDKKNIKSVFDSNGRLKEIQDKNGNKVSFSYTNNLVSKITDASGRDINLAYNTGNQLDSITDWAGRVEHYSYTSGLLTQYTDALNNSTNFVYDTSQRLTQSTDARGNTMKYDYDTSNRVIKVTDPIQAALPTPATTNFTYDSASQTSVTDTKGNITRYGFDGQGRVLSTTNASVTPNTVQYQSFDQDFNKLSETNQAGAQINREYDSSGNVTRSTDQLGAVTTNTYDVDYDNVLTTTDPKGVQQKFEYDTSGNKTKEYPDFSNKPTEFTTYEYDGNGNVTKLTDPRNNISQFSYDSYGRLTQEQLPPQTDAKTTSYTYDSAGNKLTITDPLNHVTTYEYDALNHMTKQTDATNNVTSYTYDQNGNKATETDPKGNVTTYTYDKLNQLTKTQSADPLKKTDYSYDSTGNVTQVTDGKGQASTIQYDTEGKATVETTSGVTTNVAYSAAGDVTQLKEGAVGNQVTTDLTVDKAGQAVKETVTNGSSSSTTNNSYDANGNLTQSANVNTGVTQASYDSKDQVTKETDTAYRDTNVQYDAAGNVTSLTLPSGKTLAFTYDENNRMTGVSATIATNNSNANILNPLVKFGSNTTTEATSVQYDKAGNVIKITKANGTTSDMSYDNAGKITNLTTKKEDGTVISSYTYGYDANGNVTSISGDGVSTTYTYDALDELLTATDSQNRSWTYTYDATGNRTQLVGPNGTTTYAYTDTNDKNKLMSATTGGASTTYSYDVRGNNTTRSDGTAIAYDGNNLITSAKIGTGPTVSYTYDTDKHMIARTVNGATTRYQYDNGKISAETANDGSVTIAYSYGSDGKLISQTRKDIDNPNGSAKVYYYHYGPDGSVTSMTDPSGNVVKQYQYDPYGNVLSVTGNANLTNNYTYSGYWQDPDTKLYHLQARAYDATIGRFLSVDPDPSNDDPKQDATLNANLYLYTNNNPVSRDDQTGTSWFSKVVKGVAAVAVGAAIAVVAVAALPESVVASAAVAVAAIAPRAATYIPRVAGWSQRAVGWGYRYGQYAYRYAYRQGAQAYKRVSYTTSRARSWWQGPRKQYLRWGSESSNVRYGMNKGKSINAWHVNVVTRNYNYHVYVNPSKYRQITGSILRPVARVKRR